MKTRLTNADYCKGAGELKASPATVRAVADTETRGQAFYADGFPVILFERHKFHEFTGGKYDKDYPEISNKKAGGYGKTGQHQRDKLNLALSLNKTAALKSCSWGMFQIMGFNYAECGFASVAAFVDAMKSGADAHLEAFIAFIHSNANLLRAIRTNNFASFADHYNGSEYRKNDYDGKMARAFKVFSKLDFGCDSVVFTPAPLVSAPVPAPEVTTPVTNDDTSVDDDASTTSGTETTQTEVTETESGSTVQTVQDKNEQDVTQPADVSKGGLYNGIGFMPTIKRDMAGVFGGNLTIQGIITGLQSLNGLPDWVNKFMVYIGILAMVAGAVYLAFRGIHYLVFKWDQNHIRKLEAEAKTNIQKKDINWT